jgi:PHS family inorganic phosphate transporter-like MFS transporter
MPESPRYQVQVLGRCAEAEAQMHELTAGAVRGNGTARGHRRMGLRAFLADRKLLVMLAGTAGSWFLLDYAYYGLGAA